jgi:hypothetical protein
MCNIPNKRIIKWTHEPRANFCYKKQLSDTLSTFIFSALIKSKIKNSFNISKHNQKPKNTFILLFFTFLLIDCFTLFIYNFISYLLLRNLVFDNQVVELGT